MNDVMRGMLAVSKAGHDKGRIYMIVDHDETFVYLCDGRLKSADKPKKKKYKHIQIIKMISEEVDHCFDKGMCPDDIMIRKTIAAFEKSRV